MDKKYILFLNLFKMFSYLFMIMSFSLNCLNSWNHADASQVENVQPSYL